MNTRKDTTAAAVAKRLGNDGMRWTADDGTEFQDLMEEYGAKTHYGRTRVVENLRERCTEYCTYSDYVSGDPIRYEFADGSAIVTAGDGWDIEGESAFSWANE